MYRRLAFAAAHTNSWSGIPLNPQKLHWHNHMVVNSVSCETGLKLQFNEKNLEQFRTLSDEICVSHGLDILKPYQKPKQKPMSAGEYRAAVRGGSYKFKLMNAIDHGKENILDKFKRLHCKKTGNSKQRKLISKGGIRQHRIPPEPSSTAQIG